MSTGGLFAMLTGAMIGGSAGTASATATTQVTLQNAVGTQITCATTSTWHFVANQLDTGTPAGTIVVTFNPGGQVGPVTATVVNPSEQGFYVTAPSGTQTLVTAVATFQQQADSEKPNLVLSGSPSCDTTTTSSSSTSSTSSSSTSSSTSSTSSTTSTTSTTEEGETTTTAQNFCCVVIPSTTTVAPTTSTVPATTVTTAGAQALAEQGSTSVAPTTVPTTAAPTTVKTVVLGVQGSRSLPFTGSSPQIALLAAGVLLLLGGLLLLGTDRSGNDA